MLITLLKMVELFGIVVPLHWHLKLSQSNDLGETSSQSSKSSNSSQTTVTLVKHNKLHSQLQMYAPLMHWLKATDRACYEKLLEVYTTSIGKLYERDLRQFFDEARAKVVALREKKRNQSPIILSFNIYS